MEKISCFGVMRGELDARNDVGPNVLPRLAYSPREAAAALGVHHNTVYTLLRSGQLRYSRVGRRYVISKAALEAFLGVGCERA